MNQKSITSGINTKAKLGHGKAKNLDYCSANIDKGKLPITKFTLKNGAMARYIIKASGEREPFNIQKFSHSLKRVGVAPAIIQKLADEIMNTPTLKSTRDIYSYAYNHLFTLEPAAALKYNLKHALYELGPMGFPFEQFVAEIFRHQGYQVKTNQILKGVCVDHEIDVIANNETHHAIIECKFRGIHGNHINVKVPLYVKARYEDISIKHNQSSKKPFNQLWIVTNTKFTESTKVYASCAQIDLLGWGHPKRNGIEVIIDRFRLHPITILNSLTHEQKDACIKAGLLLCRDVRNKTELLQTTGVNKKLIDKIVIECQALYNSNDVED